MSEAVTTRTPAEDVQRPGVGPTGDDRAADLPLRQTVAAAQAAAPDAVLSVVEPTTLQGRQVLHLGWDQPANGVRHDAYASTDSGRIVLVTTNGAYGSPGVQAERTGDGALAGLVPADSDGRRMANKLESALCAELPAAKETLFPPRQNLARLDAIIEHGQERHTAIGAAPELEMSPGPTAVHVAQDGRSLR